MAMSTAGRSVRDLLASGAIAFTDDQGVSRGIAAPCPDDGRLAPVYRTDRQHRTISRVIFKCPACGRQFEAPEEHMRFV